jgi:hypothetical protein
MRPFLQQLTPPAAASNAVGGVATLPKVASTAKRRQASILQSHLRLIVQSDRRRELRHYQPLQRWIICRIEERGDQQFIAKSPPQHVQFSMLTHLSLPERFSQTA